MHEIGISANKIYVCVCACVCVRAARGRPGAKAFFAGKKNERAGTRTKESRRRPVAP